MLAPGFAQRATNATIAAVVFLAALPLLSLGCTGASFDGLDSAQKIYGIYAVYAHDHFSHDGGHDKAPAIVTDGHGDWIITWQSDDELHGFFDGVYRYIFLSRSVDNGVSWSDPEPVNYSTFFADSDNYEPELSFSSYGNWNVVWTSTALYTASLMYECSLGSDPDIVSATSFDSGLNWSEPVPVNDFACKPQWSYDREPVITTDATGMTVAVWRSSYDPSGTIGIDSDIFLARSSDGGGTWSPAGIVNGNAAIDNRQWGKDFAPALATNDLGTWIAVWISDFVSDFDDGFYNVLVARSTDAGETWSPIQILTSSSDIFTPNNRPQLRADGQGNWVAVWWSTDPYLVDDEGRQGIAWNIAVSFSRDDGVTWSEPKLVGGRHSTYDLFPDIQCDMAHTWISIWKSYELTEWDSDLGRTVFKNERVYVSRSTDSGATWSDAEELVFNPGSMILDMEKPRIETDKKGNWLAVWSSYYDADGTVGDDADLFISRSSDNGLSWTPARPLGRN